MFLAIGFEFSDARAVVLTRLTAPQNFTQRILPEMVAEINIAVSGPVCSSPYSGTVVGDTPSVKVEWVWLIDGTVCGTGTIYSTAGTGYIWI